MPNGNLTARQEKWFASVREGLQRDAGKTMDEWVAIARTCPETAHRARLKWFKDTHGLLQNCASQVLDEAFGDGMALSDPRAAIDAMWADPMSRTIFEAADTRLGPLPDVIQTVRKGYTAWSRKVQFAAMRPLKGGGAMLGLAVAAEISPRLAMRGSKSWSERLTARLTLANPGDIDDEVAAWSSAAHARS